MGAFERQTFPGGTTRRLANLYALRDRMKAKRKRLNCVALVWDVVAEVMSDEDIAAKHGLSKAEVGRLRKGEGRPHVTRWIKRWKAECEEDPTLQLALMRRAAVGAMAKAIGGGASSTSLAAAKEFLNHTLGSRWNGQDADAAKASAEPRPVLDLAGLPRRLKLQVLRALGGPTDLDEPADDENKIDDDRPGRGRGGDNPDRGHGDADDEFDSDGENEDDQP
jgi:hypothetical protein